MDLSVITAVAPDRADHLDATEQSIRELRSKLNLQWIVVWDGKAIRPTAEADIVLEGRSGSGIACTRNLALPLVRAPYVTALDADDLIVSTGAEYACLKLKSDQSIGWVGLSRTFLDGAPTLHTIAQQFSFRSGELAQHWTSPFLFHPNSSVLRSDLLSRVGGWPAIASNEDLALILRISEEAAGIVVPMELTRYRVWERQEVARTSYKEMKKLAFDYIGATLNSFRVAKGRPQIVPPPYPGGAFGREKIML